MQALGRAYIDNPNKQWIETLQAHVAGPITDTAAARIQMVNGRWALTRDIGPDRHQLLNGRLYDSRTRSGTVWIGNRASAGEFQVVDSPRRCYYTFRTSQLPRRQWWRSVSA